MEETLDAVVDYDNDNLDNIAVDYAGDKNMNLNFGSKNWSDYLNLKSYDYSLDYCLVVVVWFVGS